jgi:hypothetical protein
MVQVLQAAAGLYQQHLQLTDAGYLQQQRQQQQQQQRVKLLLGRTAAVAAAAAVGVRGCYRCCCRFSSSCQT